MKITQINALTSLTPQSAKVPLTFDSELEAIECMLGSLPITETRNSRIVRIANTLEISDMDISEPLWNSSGTLELVNRIGEWKFDSLGRLLRSEQSEVREFY